MLMAHLDENDDDDVATSLREGKLWIQTSFTLLKIEHVWHPAHIVTMYNLGFLQGLNNKFVTWHVVIRWIWSRIFMV